MTAIVDLTLKNGAPTILFNNQSGVFDITLLSPDGTPIDPNLTTDLTFSLYTFRDPQLVINDRQDTDLLATVGTIQPDNTIRITLDEDDTQIKDNSVAAHDMEEHLIDVLFRYTPADTGKQTRGQTIARYRVQRRASPTNDAPSPPPIGP